MLADSARKELLARTGALIARWGAKPYLTAPLLEPNDRFFPDPYTGDLVGLRTVTRRLLHYVGLEHLAVELHGHHRKSNELFTHTSAVLTHVDEHEVEIGVWDIGEAEEVPLVLAHEVARAYHALQSKGGRGPYRSSENLDGGPEGEPDQVQEEEVSLTACYLGFGLLVALGAHRYKARGKVVGASVRTQWSHRRLGALTPDEATFLLAAHAVVREVDEATLADWGGRLSANVRSDFLRYLADLREDREALIEALGLPDRPWPRPVALDPKPLEDDGWLPEPIDEASVTHPVLRVPKNAGSAMASASGALSLGGLMAAVVTDPAWAWGVLVGGPLLAVAAYFGGKRIRRHDECTGCDAKLGADDTRCAKCGGTVVGTLREGEGYFDALARAGVRTTHDGQLVEAQADADPRYVTLRVMCPSCAWIPDGKDHWGCEHCDGDAFNTFETGGTCPHCEHTFEETWCPQCEHSAPYEWWWPED